MNEIINTFNNIPASLATATGFVLAGTMAYLTILSNRRNIREKNSIDLVNDLTTSESLQEGFRILNFYYEHKDKSIENLFEASDEESKNDRASVLRVLNYFENVAIGIRTGIYDRKVILLSRRTQIVRCYELSKPLIDKYRHKLGKKTYYENLGWLVNCIKDKEHRRIKGHAVCYLKKKW